MAEARMKASETTKATRITRNLFCMRYLPRHRIGRYRLHSEKTQNKRIILRTLPYQRVLPILIHVSRFVPTVTVSSRFTRGTDAVNEPLPAPERPCFRHAQEGSFFHIRRVVASGSSPRARTRLATKRIQSRPL